MIELLGELVEKEPVIGNKRPGPEVVLDKFENMGFDPDVWTPDAEQLRDHEEFFETQPYQEVGYEDRRTSSQSSKVRGTDRRWR